MPLTRLIESQDALHFESVTVNFGAIAALDNLNLRIPRGSVFGLLGANGSGKTTAIRVACGLLAPHSGIGHCLGEPLAAKRPQRRSAIGYMAQATTLYDELTVAENLGFRAALIGAEIRQSHLERHRLLPFAHTRVGSLSGGWRQRAAFACATLGAPRLVILDEPTNGLDIIARDEMWDAIHALAGEGTTVLISTHDAAEAAQCESIALLSHGAARYSGRVSAIDHSAAGIEQLMRAVIAQTKMPDPPLRRSS